MDKFTEMGRRLDEELTRLRNYVEEEVAPETERRAAEFLREVSEKLTVAAACGYARVDSVDSAAGVEGALRGALEGDGPSFILVRVSAEEQPVPRIPYRPEEIRDRFRRAIGSS